jgi:hypothetical protein
LSTDADRPFLVANRAYGVRAVADRAFFVQALAGVSRSSAIFFARISTTSATAQLRDVGRGPRRESPRVTNLAADPVASFAIKFPYRKLVRGLRGEQIEEKRYRVTNDVVHRLKQHLPPIRGFTDARKVTLDMMSLIGRASAVSRIAADVRDLQAAFGLSTRFVSAVAR